MNNENGNVKERLINYLKYKGISQIKFQESIGASNGYVRNIVNTIGATYAHKISMAYPDLNMGWVITGEGEMLNDVAQNRVNTNNIENSINNGSISQVNGSNDNSSDLYKQMLEMKDVIDTLKDKIAALRKNVFKASICPTVEEMKGRLNEILLEEDL